MKTAFDEIKRAIGGKWSTQPDDYGDITYHASLELHFRQHTSLATLDPCLREEIEKHAHERILHTLYGPLRDPLWKLKQQIMGLPHLGPESLEIFETIHQLDPFA